MELSAVVQEPLQNTIVVYIYMYTPDITMETLPVWVSVQSGAASDWSQGFFTNQDPSLMTFDPSTDSANQT